MLLHFLSVSISSSIPKPHLSGSDLYTRCDLRVSVECVRYRKPMSLICGIPILESVYCLACARWAWKRCIYSAGNESENWGISSTEEFQPVPRLCRYILSIYQDDLRNPIWAPPGGYGMNPDFVILRKYHKNTLGRSTPYLIYLDHDNADIVLVIRGLNLGIESDYAVLFDNKLGQAKFHGGYVHNGLLKAARWVFDTEHEVLRGLMEGNPSYTLTFAGHSLGAGVVAVLTILAVQNLEALGSPERKRIRCYAMAPPRCMSLNLAVRYADVINSVVLQFMTEGLNEQDDFLPRTTAALEDVFKSLLCLPCLLCIMCLKDTCTLEEKMITDPRRLYAPGRLYHIVERKPWGIGRLTPVVRTAVPVDGRFEHIVLSCNTTADHALLWIERESQKAVDVMVEKDQIMNVPLKQRMERQQTLAREHSQEHKAALQRAYALDVPHSFPPPSHYGTFNEGDQTTSRGSLYGESSRSSFARRKESWGDLMERILDVDESGNMVLKKLHTIQD